MRIHQRKLYFRTGTADELNVELLTAELKFRIESILSLNDGDGKKKAAMLDRGLGIVADYSACGLS